MDLAAYRDLIKLDEPFSLPTHDLRSGHDLLMTALGGLPNKHYTGTSSVAHLSTDEGLLRWLEAELPSTIQVHSIRSQNALSILSSSA